jgi:hypothetical protein
MNFRKNLPQAILFVFLAAIMPIILHAQTSNGTIAGSVVDPTGAVVPKADVKAVGTQFGAVHETQADSAGTYRLESLQPGIYDVTIAVTGFAKLLVSDVTVSGDRRGQRTGGGDH